jgi:hypothetical protein
MSSLTAGPGGAHAAEAHGTDAEPGQRPRPRPHRPLLHDIESVIPFLIALGVLVAIVVSIVITVRPHPNTNGTVYTNTYHVFSNNS